MFSERYELTQSIRFQAQGKSLSPLKLNPILARFFTLLKNFETEKDGLRAKILSLTEFEVLKSSEEQVIFQYRVQWMVSDPGQNSIYNFNNVVRPWLHQSVKEIKLKKKGMRISLFESRFPHEFWEKEV